MVFTTIGGDLLRAVRSMSRGGLNASAIAEELDLPREQVRYAMLEDRLFYGEALLLPKPRVGR